jgi:hypothetical protein
MTFKRFGIDVERSPSNVAERRKTGLHSTPRSKRSTFDSERRNENERCTANWSKSANSCVTKSYRGIGWLKRNALRKKNGVPKKPDRSLSVRRRHCMPRAWLLSRLPVAQAH